jgi:hypothetical protein
MSMRHSSVTTWIISGIPVPRVSLVPQDTARDLLHIAEVHYHSAVEKVEHALKG